MLCGSQVFCAVLQKSYAVFYCGVCTREDSHRWLISVGVYCCTNPLARLMIASCEDVNKPKQNKNVWQKKSLWMFSCVCIGWHSIINTHFNIMWTSSICLRAISFLNCVIKSCYTRFCFTWFGLCNTSIKDWYISIILWDLNLIIDVGKWNERYTTIFNQIT